jgi:dipeptidase E
VPARLFAPHFVDLLAIVGTRLRSGRMANNRRRLRLTLGQWFRRRATGPIAGRDAELKIGAEPTPQAKSNRLVSSRVDGMRNTECSAFARARAGAGSIYASIGAIGPDQSAGTNTIKLLLTSSAISNASIQNALVDLLGKPISESSALLVPTGMYPFPGSGEHVARLIRGETHSPLCDLGWKSLGVLELTALTSIQEESWVPTLRETDALLVWGGNVLYLGHWMRVSGLADLLPTLPNLVYVGVSAGSIVMTPYNGDAPSNLRFVPPGSDMGRDAEKALGFVDFGLRVHMDVDGFNTTEDVAKWASGIPAQTYGIDDETAIKVVDGQIEVISEGNWRLFNP